MRLSRLWGEGNAEWEYELERMARGVRGLGVEADRGYAEIDPHLLAHLVVEGEQVELSAHEQPIVEASTNAHPNFPKPGPVPGVADLPELAGRRHERGGRPEGPIDLVGHRRKLECDDNQVLRAYQQPGAEGEQQACVDMRFAVWLEFTGGDTGAE